MKVKPVSHKSDNIFKFESFNDRLSRINVSVLHHLKSGVNSVSSDESTTHFAITLDKWLDLNCSQHFDDLRHSIGNALSVQSLPQIIHRKSELIDILVQNLKRRDNLALNVVLELIVSLARDLNTDFYQYFDRIFLSLIDLLNTTDPELIENIFVCLTFLFKYLQKYIIKEFKINYKLLETLLKSPKDYIRKFTAESVSFLVRKAQNKCYVLDIVLESVAKSSKLVTGVAQLLFESVKGLNNEFHSCAQTLITLLFDKYLVIENDNLDQTIGLMFELLVEYISKQNSGLIWKTLLIESNSKAIALKKVIILLESVIGYKNCQLVESPSKLVQYLMKYLDNNNGLDETDKNNVLICLKYLLFNCFSYIPNEDIQLINAKLFASDCLTTNQIIDFTKSVFNCLSFERNILPSVLTFCSHLLRNRSSDTGQFAAVIRFLTELIVTKRRRPIHGMDVKNVSKYVLKFDEEIVDIFVEVINKTTDVHMIWSAFVCLPNFVPISDETKISKTIVETIAQLETRFRDNYSNNVWFGYVVVEAIVALVLLKNGKPIDELTPQFFVELMNANPSNTELLQAFDLYLSFNKELNEKALELNVLEQIYSQTLEKNLSSFCRTKRLLTLHILTLFDPPLPPSEDINNIKESVFDICFSAESISADLHQYREKLKYLQNLDFSFVKHSIPLTTSGGLNFDQMPIHYLFGALYDNLSLLWQPISKIIEGFAKGVEHKKLFCNLLFNHLKETTERIHLKESFDLNYYEKDIKNYLNMKTTQTENRLSLKPDFANHRLLLLKAMNLFPETVEPSNREFVSVFFDFINQEMSFHLIFGQNSRENIEIETELSESLMEMDSNQDQNNDKSIEVKDKPTIGRKTLWKTMFSFLTVLSKFSNPKALYREKELLEFYLNLLSSPDSEAQKSAFNCISKYNNSYLSEFSDNFLRLIDEKSFKSEIYSFILNSENDDNVLKSKNRSNIVPLIMRILYGKMVSTNGTKSHGKNKADFRRSIILKVLSVFSQNELILFLDFVFAPIIEFVRNDYKTLNETIKSKVNPKEFIPLRQLQALIRTLHFVLKHFGNNFDSITSYTYKVVVVVSTLVTHLLQTPNRRTINERSISQLKDIRSHCFKVFKAFFESIDTYSYSSVEIDALFESLIWPMLPNLDTESLSTPSPLLTLFVCLSENSRYFKMFVKSHPTNKNLTPIEVIIKIYENPKALKPVVETVTQILDNLLVLDTFTDSNDQNIQEIEVNDTNISMNDLKEDLSLGTVILFPFTSQILNRIRINFENNKKIDLKQKKKKNLNPGFSAQELNILSRLSSYVTQSDESRKLILLLINSIDMKKNEEQKELQTIKALSQLVRNVGSDVNHILKCLIPLFGVISNCISRTELCHTLQELVRTRTDLQSMSHLICDVNAFNPKFPEEPDYPKRINAFKAINTKIESISQIEFNYEFISTILYNCIYFIQFCDDLAICESASHTIKTLLKRLDQLEDNELFNTFVINLLLYSTISKGLRHKSETIRHKMIELLLVLIEMCGQRHTVLQQLSLLCNKEDEEIDFWLNIKHIQLHRRSRALSRLAKNDDLLKTFTNRVFSEFLIPLTTNFLNDIQYNKQTALLNSSIEAIGAFAKHSQWAKYYFILKYYVNQLITQKGDQKLNIRIVSSILDNFSFNSSLPSNQSIDVEIEEDVEEEEMAEEVVEKMEVIEEVVGSEGKSNDKVYESTLNRLLPLLHKCLHQKSRIEFSHDSTKNEFPEDEDIQRAPIALAIIKLLKAMNSSEPVMKANISSVFLRLCQFLQSRAQSIRDSARNTFVKVMQCLGPKYLMSALNEMRSILTKGYQRHVFVYTVHAILAELRPQLKSGDLDNCLDCLLGVCTLELFGNLSEEKDVSQITTKLKEAKKCKSFDIFQIMATFVSEKCLTQLLMPLKTTLSEAHNHKIVRKVSQSLSKVGQGLNANSALTEKTYLLFIYGLINDMIPELQMKSNESKKKKEVKRKAERVDSFLISKPIYQRTQRVTRISETSNAHIICEFGLNCFLALIKQNRVQASNGEHLSLVDPFIIIFENLLESNDPKLTTVSLQCLHSLYTKFGDLPTFGTRSEHIMKTIFVLLHKYAKFGINDKDDDNVQMVLLSFKTLSLFIKDRTDVTVNDEQMTVLLSYVDQDLHNDSRQSTVFIILKSILSRRHSSLALHRIMKKIAEMAITSQSDSIRNNCSQLSAKYLIDYSPAKGLKSRINFFILNLEFDRVAGRESALNVLKQVISAISYDYLVKNIAIFFVPLSSRLVNESSSECKKLVANSIEKLLKRITETDRNKLFNDMVVPWLQSKGVVQTLLASHLCSLFLSVEDKDFIKRLPNCMPFLTQQLDPNRYENIESEVKIGVVKTTDSLVYQHLSLFLKLMKVDPQLTKKSQSIDDVNAILDYILSHHLLHPHLWVRVISTQILGQLFSYYSIECLANSMNNPLESYEFLISGTKEKLIQISNKLCLIFRDIYDAEVICDQLIKNLVYISRVFIEASAEDTSVSSFKWMTNKLIFEVKYEVKNSPQLTKKRISVFKWMAAVAIELGNERLEQYLANFLPLLCSAETNSELLDTEDNELIVLTKQVLQLFNNMIGTEKFVDYYTKAKTQLTLKRIERKKNNAIQSVNDVVRSAKRKVGKHNKSKESKKRKISHFKRLN